MFIKTLPVKKIIFIIVLSLTSTGISTFQSCSSTTALSRSNIGTVESSLLNVLTSKLGLNSMQIPLVSNLLKVFLNNKLSIVGLAKSNPSAYTKQLVGLQNSLRSSLATPPPFTVWPMPPARRSSSRAGCWQNA